MGRAGLNSCERKKLQFIASKAFEMVNYWETGASLISMVSLILSKPFNCPGPDNFKNV